MVVTFKSNEVTKLTERANHLREVLNKSKNVSEEMITILSSFDDRLSNLETAMKPIQQKTLAFRKAHANIDSTIKQVETVLSVFDVPKKVEPRIREGPRGNFEAYLSSLDELSTAISYFDKHKAYKSSEKVGADAKKLMAEAMKKLEAEVRQMLKNNSKSMDPDMLYEAMPELSGEGEGEEDEEGGGVGSFSRRSNSTSSLINWPPLLLPSLVDKLNAIAQRMITNGGAGAYLSAYKEIRDDTMQSTLKRLGVEKLKREDVWRMQWEELENKIANWIQHIKIAMTIVFPEERKLCEQVFRGLEPHNVISYAELAFDSLSMLLSFGEAIAESQKAPEKLFVLLDMYETMRDVMPKAEDALSGNACIPCRESLKSLQRALGQISMDTFAEFEEAVEKDSTRTPVADGTVHPLTSYVINFVKFLFDYEGTLRQIFEEAERDGTLYHNPSGVSSSSFSSASSAGSLGGGPGGSSRPKLAVATLRIMTVLENNLEAKSRLYKDPALTQLFLMNNKNYIVRSIRKSEQARRLLGEDWIQRHRRTVQQHQANYQKYAWGKILSMLAATNEPVNKNTFKEKFKNFNAAFEDLHTKQCQWTIPDQELRRTVRQAIADVIIPAYKEFIRRHSTILPHFKQPQKYFKYQPSDVERVLEEFFEGKTVTIEPTKATKSYLPFGKGDRGGDN